MGFYRGVGGVVWEIDPPDVDKYPNQAEVFAARVTSGELVECQADGSDLDAKPAKAPAKKAASKAED